MDKQNNTPESNAHDQWLDEILGIQNAPKELEADELAVAAAGLTHPDDAELEKIVQETLAENWGADPGQTVLFTPAEVPAQPETAEAPVQPQKVEKKAPVEKEPEPAPQKKKLSGLRGIPHVFSTAIWVIIILTVGISLGRLVYQCATDLLALGKTGFAEGDEVTVTIAADDTISDVAAKLKQAGMIRYTGLFELFANITGKGDDVIVGSITFTPNTVYDYNALLNALSYRGDSIIEIEVMIPEGYNCAQIFALLEKEGICSAKTLEKYVAETDIQGYWFLDGVERGHKYWLEGFLFPDTYKFYKDSDPDLVIAKFLDGFDYRFSARMVDKFVALNNRLGDHSVTFYELIIMASIVEKEKANPVEGYTIASVFYNRLQKPHVYPVLNSDATILYATDYRDKGLLITNDQINASPYNTYTQPGLPPTPIANPGLASLDAALDPDDSDYYYFILDKSINQHRFSRTLEEHERLRRELGYLS
jgi:UPF0755 protein